MSTTGLRVAARRGISSSVEGVSKVSNGLSVLSVPESGRGAGMLRVSVLGGSRYEKYENLGASHALRVGAGLTSGENTYFGITRTMQQAGASFHVDQGREIMSYSLCAKASEIPAMSDIFLDSVSNPAFKHWEVSNTCPVRIRNDIGNQSPASMAQELLYKAAFRTGLGNSIYAPSYMIGTHSAAVLKDFFSKAFVADKAVLIGVGVPTESLHQIAERISLTSSGSSKPAQSVFVGTEARSEHNGIHAHIALGFSGPGQASSPKEKIAATLYQRILGVGPRVNRGFGLGQLSKVSESSISCIADFHQDAGLFGAYLAVSDHKQAGNAVRKALEIIKNPKVTEAEVKAAKKNVLTDLCEQYLSPSGMCDALEEQVLLGGGKVNADIKAAEASINAITVGDVQAFAKKISSSPMAMGAVGNLEHLPYLDEL